MFSNLIFNLRLAVNLGKFDCDENELFGKSSMIKANEAVTVSVVFGKKRKLSEIFDTAINVKA